MVRIEVGGKDAMIEGYKWTGEDANLVKILDSLLDPAGPSGADPYPDLTAATSAAKILGGEVVEYDELPDGPKDLVI